MEIQISIIMSVYNETEKVLLESIESIINQTYEKIEFIIILDNPQNKDAEKLLELYEKKDNRIRLIKNKKNIGLVRSLNKGIQNSKGTIIARMDADDVAYLNRLQMQIETIMKLDVDFVVSGADLIFTDGRKQKGEKIGDLDCEKYKKLLKYGHLSIHSTWMFKREIFEKLIGYRNFYYVEDVDFLLRAIQAGYRCYRMKENTILYRLRVDGVSKTYALEQFNKACELRRCYKKDMIVQDISSQDVNLRFSNYTLVEKEKFQKADQAMDDFVSSVRDKKYGKACCFFLKNFTNNIYYRRLFIKNVIFRCKLIQISLVKSRKV